MTRTSAGITISVDGYITGPDDGPGQGLGEGGERLHYWVFGGPWTYEKESRGEATGEAKAYFEDAMARCGAVVCGRNMYESARHWGGKNPWGPPAFIVTHRPDEEPDSGEFIFVDGVEAAIARAQDVAGDKEVNIGGGGDVIRQALAAGLVDQLDIIVAPVILGGGKRLFEGFGESLDLEPMRVRESPLATFISYRVK